ncbi:dihydrofolate reductase [Hydrogenophaga palleronii]|uniref:Dihydrofolate reductase n=1 Tax=Hydrogenophaga palleronii TaxID=65655 RepID=A0ABU1WIZ5_9BURK|nr:dihydrofolate reductase [Hydrogenophaga palleronii]MDR7149254.1 dihydrofolate reductase [Hydrogenophaga palleronii]
MSTETTRLHLIFARAANGVIGKDNALPWHLPEDMAHFKRTTLGCPVIMGRKTWDSLPPRFRPLPGRLNIVVSRNASWQADGALRAASLADALALCPPDADAWVIGGAQIYAAALPLAQTAVVTEIAREFEGDAYAPAFGPAWHEVARESHTGSNGLPYAFVTYTQER